MKESNDLELNVSFAEKYGIYIDEYIDVPITALPFSTRVINCLNKNGISNLKAFLESSPQTLMAYKGFGKTCLEEVKAFFNKDRFGECTIIREEMRSNNKAIFKQYTEYIALGDFSFANELSLSKSELEILNQYKKAYNILGENLSFDSVFEEEKVIPIMEMFVEYQNNIKRRSEVLELAKELLPGRCNNKALGYINAFTLKESERIMLKKFCKSEKTTIMEMVRYADLRNNSDYLLFIRFLKWCSFDLYGEIEGLFEQLYTKARYREVLQRRAQKQTLEQIGSDLGVTRERIRQIEVQAKKVFSKYYSHIRIISKISAEKSGDRVLTSTEIEEYGGIYSQELLFLLKSYESANYIYDRQLDVFVLGDDSIHDRVCKYIESLPDIIKVDRLPVILEKANEDEDIPKEAFEKAFLESYRITGNLYHRFRLSLTSVYGKILEKYYPQGLKVYDSDEIRQFRARVTSEYGDVGMPENDRALTARISSICILCGRGIYKLKQKEYISKELAYRIHKYILDSENPVFMTNTLFSVFEEDLVSAGVDNKYYLQGILHELFADEFTFRRDYISKDANITTIYSAVVDFIKKSQYPVTKALIQTEFPGITEIVINFAISDPNILNYFGEYLHCSRLKLTDVEKTYLYSVLKEILSDGQPHHSKDIYEIISGENPEIFTRNAALYQYSAFSILEYLFKDLFQFSRPYIALNGVDIGRPSERLHDMIYSSDEFAVAAIGEFARENHFQIQSILEYINECNDEYMLVDATMMMRISNIGITKELAAIVDKIVSSALTETMPIYQLDIWNQLPKLNVPWTEWLLYSVIYKWGEKTSVSTTSNQFRMAVPLAAPSNMIDVSAFDDSALYKSVEPIKIDNLDDIDSLLENIIDDDIWKEDL